MKGRCRPRIARRGEISANSEWVCDVARRGWWFMDRGEGIGQGFCVWFGYTHKGSLVPLVSPGYDRLGGGGEARPCARDLDGECEVYCGGFIFWLKETALRGWCR